MRTPHASPRRHRRSLLGLFVGLLFLPVAALAQVPISETVVHSLAPEEGFGLFAPLAQGTDGNFYGTVETGPSNDFGSVFQVTPAGGFTILHSFTGGDGYFPFANLVQGSDGNFYGTTLGSVDTGGFGTDFGQVFQVSAAGALSAVHAFSGADGALPVAGLILASDGNYYGTTELGGASGDGSVFQLTPAGVVNTLYSFTGGADGRSPQAGVVQGSDGALYGTTTAGGGPGSFGTVFRVTTDGQTFTSLHSFSGADGSVPAAALVAASDGNLYGSTSGESSSGAGTIFKITTGGAFTNLYTFVGTFRSYPFCSVSNLIQGRDGNLYGTSAGGGANNLGTAFMITPGGVLTTIWSFGVPGDGATPCAGVVQGRDGNLYGTTLGGGASANGAVYEITIPQPAVAAAPVITTTSLPPGQAYSASTAGIYYGAQLSGKGVLPLTWSATGLPPGLSLDPHSGVISGSITSDVPDTYNVGVSLTDNSGYSGPPVQTTLTLSTSCGSPTLVAVVPVLACGVPPANPQWPTIGDDRDRLIYEHVARGVLFHPAQLPPSGTSVVNPAMARGPHCDDFAQSGPFTHYFPNFGAVTSQADVASGLEAYAACGAWTVLSGGLASPALPGPQYGLGLDAWISALLDMGDAKAASRQIVTSYSDPDRNSTLHQGHTTQNVHQFGGAVDLSLFARCGAHCTRAQLRDWEAEWDKVVAAARWANFPRIEGSKQHTRFDPTHAPGACFPGNLSCVHADLGHGPHSPNVTP